MADASEKLNAGKVAEHLERTIKAHTGIHHHARQRALAHYAAAEASGTSPGPQRPPGGSR